jgi:hypothetical protein
MRAVYFFGKALIVNAWNLYVYIYMYIYRMNILCITLRGCANRYIAVLLENFHGISPRRSINHLYKFSFVVCFFKLYTTSPHVYVFCTIHRSIMWIYWVYIQNFNVISSAQKDTFGMMNLFVLFQFLTFLKGSKYYALYHLAFWLT